MPTIVRDLFASKKFVFTLLTSILLIAGAALDIAVTKEQAQHFLLILWPVYIAAQGIADIGDKLAYAKIAVQDSETQTKSEQMQGVNIALQSALPLLAKSFGVDLKLHDPKDHATAAAFNAWLTQLDSETLAKMAETMTPAQLVTFTTALQTALSGEQNKVKTPPAVTEPTAKAEA